MRLKALETKGACMDSLIRRNDLTPEEWKIVFGGTQDQYNKFLMA
jgi:hypothetical protein